MVAHFLSCHSYLLRVPSELQNWKWARPGGWLYLRLYPSYLGDDFTDMGKPAFPLLVLRIQIDLAPYFDCSKHSHDFFLTDLHWSAKGMVRRTVLPGGLNEIFSTEQETSTLRPSQEFAAAVADQICSP